MHSLVESSLVDSLLEDIAIRESHFHEVSSIEMISQLVWKSDDTLHGLRRASSDLKSSAKLP